MQAIIAKTAGYLTFADSLTALPEGGATKDITMLPVPQTVQQIGGTQTIQTDVNDIVTDAVYGYTLDRDFANKVLVVFNLANPELAPVKTALKESCPGTPAGIAVVDGSVFITSPEDKLLLKIENPLTSAIISRLTLPCEPFRNCSWKARMYSSQVKRISMGRECWYQSILKPWR